MRLNITIIKNICIYIFLLTGYIYVYAQDKTVTIKGTILYGEDDKSQGAKKGDPIIGATISVRGDVKKATATDYDGNFELKDVNVGSTIVIKYVGFKEVTRKVTDPMANVSVSMMRESIQIEEVVAVGYATQKKADVTGAVTDVGEKDMKLTVNTGLDQALQGRAAGVQVQQTSGSPGAAASVRIRGVGSVNGTEPLYVVDGVPVDYGGLNLLNPNDIERMDVLKDASAAAIYGARGANGVVMITTKRGKDGKAKFEYESNIGFQDVWKRLEPLNTAQYKDLMQDFYKVYYKDSLVGNNTRVVDLNSTKVNKAYTTNYPEQADTRWLDQFFKRGYIQSHNITARGGNKYITSAVSLGYFKESGTLIKSQFERFTFRVNTDVRPKEWFNIGQSLSVGQTEGISPIGTGEAFTWGIRGSPLIPVFDENNQPGGFGGNRRPSIFGSNDMINPMAGAESNFPKNTSTRILGNVFAEIRFFRKFKWKTNAGVDLNSGRGSFYGEVYNYGNTEGRNRQVNTASESADNSYMWLLDHTLTYANKIGDHDISILAGVSTQYFYRFGFGASATQLPAGLRNIGTTEVASVPPAGSDESETKLNGYIARANYAFRDKYLLTLNGRYDGSSRFGSLNRYAFFPSFSVGWRLSNENFLKDAVWLSDLKLRLGWGQTGMQDGINDYAYTQQIYTGILRYPLGPADGLGNNTIYTAYAPTRGLANPALKWETVEQLNFGIDFAILQNSLIVNFDIFDKTSKDMLLRVPIPGTTGVTDAPFLGTPSYLTNIGSIKNQGIEVAITYRNEKGALKHTLSPNVSFIRNEVTNLENLGGGGRNAIFAGGASITEVGQPIGTLYGWVNEGTIKTKEELDQVRKLQPKAQLGDLKFKDINGDGKLDDADRTYLGKTIPTMSYGINYTLSYKGFDFRLFLQGVAGQSIYNSLRSNVAGMVGGAPPDPNQLVEVIDRSRPDKGYYTDIPWATPNDENQNNRVSNRWVEDGSYMRVKSTQLGFTFNEKMMKRVFNSKDDFTVRIYFSTQNLFTFTSYKGSDPEMANYGRNASGINSINPLTSGIDYGTYPQARRYTMGIQFTF
ncbi:MAG: TonB-dependent receptor [Cytophagales bacterium]|nr:TonB-dependent receptor [Cytophagales bacterium]